MAYPTPSAYQDALQFPATAFADPVLAAGEPATNALGLPQPITGAFAAVFPVETAQGRFAVRCFLTDAPDLHRRYRALAEHLAGAGLPYTAGFEFQREGIRVGGAWYPILKMAWVEGEGLARFVERHLDRPEVLRDLAAAWRGMLADLAAAGVAHGDLQHGNVLVQETDGGPRLRLVDYDAMWVPALRGLAGIEVGHRNYQHPDRTESDFDASLDHFAGLVVATALAALAERPGLWATYSTGENLLFQAGDFYDPAASPLFADLRGIEPARPLAEALRTACYLEPSGVPSLGAVLAGEAPEAAPGRKERRVEMRPARRSRFEAAFVGIAGAAVAAAVGLGAWRGEAGFAFAVIVTIMLGITGRKAYRRQPLVHRRRRIAREAAALDRWIVEAEAERAGLVAERRAYLDGVASRQADRLAELRDEALQRRLKHHFVNELDADERVGHRAVIRLKAVGIRDAFQATPERVAEARGLTSETRARIAAWREGLAARYADEAPDELSPAEVQRLRRLAERRLKAFDDALVRVAAKREVQREERLRLERLRDGLPDLSPVDYVLFLLRLRPLPSTEAPRSAPILQRPGEPAESERPAAAAPSEGAWWEQV